MKHPLIRFLSRPHWLALAALAFMLTSCGQPDRSAGVTAEDPNLAGKGTVEVSARLVEIPEGAIFKRDLYDYATILKYEVLRVHRGQPAARFLYVAHYNPWKPRADAADQRTRGIGGTLRQFRAGDIHRMALEVPLDDFFMGGLVNKYFGQQTGPLHWAVWTNPDAR